MTTPLRVLVLCTGNSARSQIAEGLLRLLGRGDIEAFSAGLEPKGLNPLAVQVMSEIGIVISRQRSKHLNEYIGQSFDYVISVCDNAQEHCPIFPGNPVHLHWDYPDPAAVDGSEATKLRAFRTVRDNLRRQIRDWLRTTMEPAVS